MTKLHERVWRKLPCRVQQALKQSGVTHVAGIWLKSSPSPVTDPDFPWPLRGPLSGHRMRIAKPEDYWMIESPYEPLVAKVLEQTVRPGWRVIDAGSHVGYHTLLMAKLVGSEGHVIAFDASLENTRILKFNVELNRYESRVSVVNMALGDGSEHTVDLFHGDTTFTGSIMPPQRNGQLANGVTAVSVRAVSLDGFLSADQRVDMVKIDVEGAEALVLAGMKRILANDRPWLIIEFHNDIGWSGRQFLQDAGYRLFDLEGKQVSLAGSPVYQCVAAPPGSLA